MMWLDTRRQADRFPITAPMIFREHGDSQWHRATTVNVSRSGVLFRSDGPLPVLGRTIDFVVTLLLGGRAPQTQVRCTGHVVRLVDREVAGGGQAVAVAIDGYAIESWRRA